jgi:hypothetical protein
MLTFQCCALQASFPHSSVIEQAALAFDSMQEAQGGIAHKSPAGPGEQQDIFETISPGQLEERYLH